MKHIGKIILIGFFILLLAAVTLVIVWAKQPQGTAMELDVPVEVQAKQVDIVEPAQPAQKTCGETGIMRLLVHGRASPMLSGHYGADAVRLVIVNFDVPSAAVLALPAELWVNSPVLADQGIEQAELNMVYQTAWETAHGEPDDVRTQKATQALAQTIVDNFEFVPDHYITVEEEAYIEFIDEIGGVDVTLTSAVDGTSEGYGTYNAGVNHLDGLRTLNLTRLVHPSAQPEPDIWGSLSRQDAVLQGMLTAALKPENLGNLPDLVKALRKVVTTDLSVDQALDLACMLQEVGESAGLESVGPPPYLVTIDAEGRMMPDVEGIKALLAQMAGGN